MYVDPSDPNLAIKDNPAARWFEASLVCLPFLAALATFLAGLTRRLLFWRRHCPAESHDFAIRRAS